MYLFTRNIMSMTYRKSAVSPLLTHWRYHSLALSHQCDCPSDRQATLGDMEWLGLSKHNKTTKREPCALLIIQWNAFGSHVKTAAWNKSYTLLTLQIRHNERDGVSNHQPHDCLLKRFQAQMKQNIKAPRHWTLRGEFTGDRWISRTKSQ